MFLSTIGGMSWRPWNSQRHERNAVEGVRSLGVMQPAGVAVDELGEPVVTRQGTMSDCQVELQVSARSSCGKGMKVKEFGYRGGVLIDLVSIGGEATLWIVLVVLDGGIRCDDLADEVHGDTGGQLDGFLLGRCRCSFRSDVG